MGRSDYGVNFNGKRIVHPGAYDQIDASAMLINAPGSLNLPVIVGDADAGEPGTLKWFSNPESAHQYVRGGDINTAIDLVVSPSNDGGGGGNTFGIVVVNNHDRALLSKGGLKWISSEYGEGGNKVQVSVEEGTVPNSKRIYVNRWDLNKTEMYNNVGVLFQLQYTGSEAFATVETKKDTKNIITHIVTKVGKDGATAEEDLNIDLTSGRFNTVSSLIKYINSIYGYKAVIINPDILNLPLTSIQDIGAPENIKSGAYIYDLKSCLLYQINKFSELVTVEMEKDATEITNFDTEYLVGGKRGTPPISWEPHFNTLKKYFYDMLIVLSSDQSIQMEALAHIQQMEQRKQKQMLFTGGALGESIDNIKKRASAFNSSRAVLGYPDILYKPVTNGVPTVLPSYFTGALIAGRVSGVSPSEPITFDYVNVSGLATDLVAGDPEIDDLITSGVCTLERVQNGGVRIAQGITTYISDNNILYREISVRRNADDLSTKMTKSMEDTFVGKKGLKASILAVKNKAIEILTKAVQDGDIVSFRDIAVRFVGTGVYIDYEVSPAEPINYILVTSHFVPSEIIS